MWGFIRFYRGGRMSIESRLTKLEGAADAADPEPIVIRVMRVDMAARRANPDAPVVGREERRIVVHRKPQ